MAEEKEDLEIKMVFLEDLVEVRLTELEQELEEVVMLDHITQ